LLVRCPSTSKLTDTGKDNRRKMLANSETENAKVYLWRHCGGVHSWKKEDVILGRAT